VSIQLKAVGIALPYPDGHSAVKRFCGTRRVRRQTPQIGPRRSPHVRRPVTQIDVCSRYQVRRGAADIRHDKSCQVHALRESEIQIACPAGTNLLLVSHIGCINARILVALIEEGYVEWDIRSEEHTSELQSPYDLV